MPKTNKLAELKAWMKEKQIFSSNQVRAWGQANFYGSARTRAQDLASYRGGNFLRRLPDYEIKSRGLSRPGLAKVAWWVVI